MSAVPEPSTVKRALSAHAAIGLIAGALLYIVSLTGAVAVFYEELQRIEQPLAPEMERVSPAAVQRAVVALLDDEKGKPKTTHLYVHMPVEELPRATVMTDTSARHFNADGSLANPEEIAWSDFLVALHYTLNLQPTAGITLVGLLGVMMLALALTGVVSHPRIFRDAFVLRARGGGGLALADWHNRMSVWSLPFSVAIALTGAVIGLGSITAYAIASLTSGGDVEKVYQPLFGREGAPDKSPASAPDVAAALDQMARAFPERTVAYVTVHEPLTKGQEIQISALHDRRLIFGENYRFAADGRFLGAAGLADGEIGQQAAASNYRLHFGNFGGLWVKLAYVLFGLALTAICATGTYIWLGKRQRRGHDEPRLIKAWDAVVWGAPAVLAVTFLVRVAFGNGAAFAGVFWGGCALLVGMALTPVGQTAFRRGLHALLLASAVAVAVALLLR